MRRAARRTGATAWLLAAALAGCQVATTDALQAGRDDDPAASAVDDGFLQVHVVEASGPPQQDPSGPQRPVARPRTGEAEPDPEDPDAAEARVTEARRELEREQARRLEIERENGALQVRVRDLEARVISLSLERTRLEQELLQLRIDALRAELDRLGDGVDPGR